MKTAKKLSMTYSARQLKVAMRKNQNSTYQQRVAIKIILSAWRGSVSNLQSSNGSEWLTIHHQSYANILIASRSLKG
jgi:hypothetical protein